MISFDDYGGSGGGDVDLNPIYQSLGMIKSNTHIMWDFISTISNTTISYSTPYLETYRSAMENYMYNITGALPTLFTNNNQIIYGNVNGQNIKCGQGDYNYTLSINKVSELISCTFSNYCLNLVGDDFYNLSFNDILFLDLNCRTLHEPKFSNNSFVNISAFNVIGLTYQNNFNNNKKINLSGFGEFSFNGFSQGDIININNYDSFINNTINKITSINLKDINNINMNELLSLSKINIACYSYMNNTISSCQDAYLSVYLMTGNSLSGIKKLILEGNDILTNTFNGITKFNILNNNLFSNNRLSNIINFNLDASGVFNNTFSGINCLNISAYELNSLKFYEDKFILKGNNFNNISLYSNSLCNIDGLDLYRFYVYSGDYVNINVRDFKREINTDTYNNSILIVNRVVCNVDRNFAHFDIRSNSDVDVQYAKYMFNGTFSENDNIKINCVQMNNVMFTNKTDKYNKVSIDCQSLDAGKFSFINELYINALVMSNNQMNDMTIGNAHSLFGGKINNLYLNSLSADNSLLGVDLTCSQVYQNVFENISGTIIADYLHDCTFNSCTNLKVLARTLGANMVNEGGNITFEGDVLHDGNFVSVSGLALLYERISKTGIYPIYFTDISTLSLKHISETSQSNNYGTLRNNLEYRDGLYIMDTQGKDFRYANLYKFGIFSLGTDGHGPTNVYIKYSRVA